MRSASSFWPTLVRLPPADLEVVANWQHRVAGTFFIFRYLKKHSIFLSSTGPAHAYGVFGLVSPIEELAGPYLPVAVQAVLLPFEERIIYDSLANPVSFRRFARLLATTGRVDYTLAEELIEALK